MTLLIMVASCKIFAFPLREVCNKDYILIRARTTFMLPTEINKLIFVIFSVVFSGTSDDFDLSLILLIIQFATITLSPYFYYSKQWFKKENYEGGRCAFFKVLRRSCSHIGESINKTLMFHYFNRIVSLDYSLIK